MKKILWLTFIFTLLFVSHSFADYNLTAKPTGTTINATLVGGLNNYQYQLVVQTTPFDSTTTYSGKKPGAQAYISDPITFKRVVATPPLTTGTATWSIIGNKANTLYYIRVLEIPSTSAPAKYVTEQASVTTGAVTISFDTLKTEKVADGEVIVKGKITDQPFNPSQYKAILYFTKEVPRNGATTITSNTGAIQSSKTAALGGPEGINDDGTYYWHLSGLSPSTTYYIQQTISAGVNSKVGSIDHFDSSTGNIVASATDQVSYDKEHSYTLLSPFPNFSVLPDPDLCAQKIAANGGVRPANLPFCDMNDVINYFLKLLIGLSAVVLVFRLMYEGYVYMTSDMPFKLASSKGSFFAALGGLLLALTSYIILNTINPKLVNNNIGITQLAIGIDGDANIPTIFIPTGQMPKDIYCPGSGKSAAIAKIAQSYKGKVTYSQTNKSAAAQSDGYARLDCSSFVNTVLNCAGYKAGTDFINEGTSSIFGNSEKLSMSTDFVINGGSVSVKGKVLNPGDLVGWPPAGGAGHVLIYVGNATFMDSHGGAAGRQPGNAIGVYTATQIKTLYGGSAASKTINSIKRIPV
ncbi:MAG: hypothetical protein JWL92_106 [Candidatus Nomurabacteria bacterium]|nr:hypothetical protein [Candidatus Nomurabacteria bacterium]